ncbi:aspartic peptidase domain-containing protein [Cercophora scortea]|uniref:Aspartic peptidase domain-containing protein n=1 Tax=Cercophora scortea TaxID=314031 RepID=A0AAE0IPL3_9PEZI|nr:aspartic peptidase domain-containing protein [Cercophora scortea]
MAFYFCRLAILLILSFFHALSVASVAASPREAVWSTDTFGPDGPWNAVEVTVGAQANKMALFPGRRFHSFVITTEYCAFNSTFSHCQAGSLPFSKDLVETGGIQFRPPIQPLMAGVAMHGNNAQLVYDTFNMQFDTGTVPNVSMALVDSQMMVYPGGGMFPAFAGCLSLGAPDVNQTFVLQDGNPNINTSIIPWYLTQRGVIPSSSYGLHIGSAAASAEMAGSLFYGGYDRNRIVGGVLTLDGDFEGPILLQDIGIKVVKGSSPFDFPVSKTGLLASGNSSISAVGITVALDACSPYMTLPKSACDSIAAALPVTYNESLGLYLWNTDDARYSQIVSSASVLTFTFMGESNTETLTINVPFRHLNLTLAPPLVPSPVPYFPCSTGGTGAYILGRAFLQDAFLSGNWETKKLFLAQAPGPNIQTTSNAVSIGHADVSISGSENDWETSWDGFWTALSPAQLTSTGTAAAATNTASGGSSSTNANAAAGLSTMAMAGIGVGVGVVTLAILGVVLFCWRRRARERLQAAQEAEDERKTRAAYSGSGSEGGRYEPRPPVPVEAHGSQEKWAPAEVEGSLKRATQAAFEAEGGQKRGMSKYYAYELP